MSVTRDARDGWTIRMALAEFEAAGMPVNEGDFAAIIRHLRGFKSLGEVRKPPGSLGGRGDRLYQIGDLQHLHAVLTGPGWLI